MRRLDLPSVDVAIVQGGAIPRKPIPAAPAHSRSESVRFQAVYGGIILLLEQDGKLSLDDRVSKFVPAVTRAPDVTIRQLLTHTAGYDDYYATLSNAAIYRDSTFDAILQSYGERPLDFEPGTDWEYSNTDYAILTKIVEIAAACRTASWSASHFRAAAYDQRDLSSQTGIRHLTIAGYERTLLGPIRWLAGRTRMAQRRGGDCDDRSRSRVVGYLADRGPAAGVPVAHRDVHRASIEVGASSGYGFGWYVGKIAQYNVASHSGFVQGFSAENALVLDSGFAGAVLSNETNSVAPEFLAEHIAGAFQYFPHRRSAGRHPRSTLPRP